MSQSEYDEDLTVNPWYSTFSQKYEDLFNRAANERWMICIPKINSWIKETKKDGIFSQTVFETHLIKPIKVYSNSDSLQPADQNENKYISFNGKEARIEGNTIYCGVGFDNQFNKPSFNNKNEQLELHLEACHSVKILFEETFFNQNDESYIVVCLSQPLEPHLSITNNNEENSSEVIPHTLTCPRYKMYGLHLWTRSSNVKLQQILDEKIKSYNQLHVDIRKGGYKSENALPEILSISANVEDLLLSCKQVLMKDFNLVSVLVQQFMPLKKKLMENSKEKAAVKNSLEGYVLHGIYETVIQEINNVMAVQDSYFNKITRNLYSVKISFFGAKECFWSAAQRARKELSKLNRYRTATEKITCLCKSISFLAQENASTKQTGPAVIGSDELLPLLVYLVIKADIPNWMSNFMYMEHLNFTEQLQEKMRFYLTTLEAAIEYIKNEKINSQNLKRLTNSNEDPNLKELFKMIFEGNVNSVERLLRQANDLHKLQIHDKCHPLCECTKCSKSLLSSTFSYINISTRDQKGRTALHIAALSGGHEMVDMLVKYGADVNACDYLGNTPLHIAASEGNQSVIFLLLHHGANATSVNNNNNSALHLSCLGGHEGCVKALLYFDPCKLLVEINGKNENGETPLFIAAKWGYDLIVRVLMEYGADNMKQNRKKETLLQVCHNYQVLMALKHEERELTRFQPSKSTNVVKFNALYENSKVYYPGWTLLKNLQTVNTEALSVKSPISSKKHGNAGKLVFPKNMAESEEQKRQKEIDKLMCAVLDNDVNMVSFLLAWNLDASKKVKCHPLCQCNICHPENMDMGVSVNSFDTKSQTPLIIASQHGYFKMAELLVGHGATLDLKSRNKKTALHLACQFGFPEIVKLLLESGSNLEARDKDGNSPIFLAAMNGHSKCLNLLLEFNASVNTRNHAGDSPLHLATWWKHGDIVCSLLEHGAMTYYKNERGKTVVDLAQNDSELLACFAKEPSLEINQSDDCIENSDQSASPRRSISQSEADELLATNLYIKFNDPVPDTPPMYAGEEMFSFEPIDNLTSGNLSDENVTAYNLDVNPVNLDVDLDDLNTSDLFDDELNSSEPVEIPQKLSSSISVQSGKTGGFKMSTDFKHDDIVPDSSFDTSKNTVILNERPVVNPESNSSHENDASNDLIPTHSNNAILPLTVTENSNYFELGTSGISEGQNSEERLNKIDISPNTMAGVLDSPTSKKQNTYLTLNENNL